MFDELLLDADWAVNAGMWMWMSSSSFFQQFFHCYCPVRFGRRADPNGDYIRKYLPILKVCSKVQREISQFILSFRHIDHLNLFIIYCAKLCILFFKNFPTRYIHEPWNAPEGIQKAAKCIIGREYSLPMVDHAMASRTNKERLRQVYHQLYKYRDPSKIQRSFSIHYFY